MSASIPTPPAASARPAADWWLLTVLTASYLCNGFDRMIVSIVLEPIKRDFQLTDSQVGIVASLAYGLAVGVAVVPIGMLIDRIQRRRLLAILMTVWSVASSLGAVVASFPALVVARMAVGAAESGGSPLSISMIGDAFAPARRGTAIGIFYVAAPLGAGLAFLIGGAVAASHGWRATFLVSGIPGLLVTVLLLLTTREPARGHQDAGGPNEKPVSVRAIFRMIVVTPALRNLMFALAVASLAQSSYLSWQASHLIRAFDLPVGQIGALIAAQLAICGALGSLLGGWLGDAFARGSRPRLVLTSAAITTLGIAAGLAGYAARSPAAAITCFMVFGFVFNAYYGPGFSAIANLAPPRARGSIFSVFYVLLNIVGFGMGPFIAGWFSDIFGGSEGLRDAQFLVGGMCATASLLFYGLSYRSMREDT